ncbi:SdpI family protein [Nocardiopsis potens]|uniref:SdpI family protein n=1 Tax=Nocardiopsis potens TaxID=1246458 RepID=UPI00034B8528|nr:SdpI family protein [Nocardiopsis potens]
MSDWTVVGSFFVLLAGFLAWTARHSVRPGVDIRTSPGVRVPTTLASEQAWHAAHRRARPFFLAGAAAALLASPAFLAWGALAEEPGAATAPMFTALGAVTALLAVGAARGIGAARTADRP